MIQVFANKFKIFSQKDYNDIIYEIDINTLTCPNCNHTGNFVHHGSYKRYIQVNIEDIIKIIVFRVKCKFCGKTHALMPVAVIPFSKFSIADIISALKRFQNNAKVSQIIDMFPIFNLSTLRAILHRFKTYWEQKLVSIKITMSLSIDFIKSCFSNYFSQFMQIANIKNILFVKST